MQPAEPNASQTSEPLAIRMENITRRFPGVVANEQVQLRVRPGAFHAVIGENGAGKSTLLNILYGCTLPDTGRIFLHGNEVTGRLRSPADAIRLGVGLVSQHYALIPALSVLENIILGAEPAYPGGALNRRAAIQQIQEHAASLGIADLDLDQPAERLSVAAGQKVEILKALMRGARILLLDEPTATLAPQEADSLFALLHELAGRNSTIVFVTHKLREVMLHSDAVTVLRAGHNAGDYVTQNTSAGELLSRMVPESAGRLLRIPLQDESEPSIIPVPAVSRIPVPHASPLLQVEDLFVRNARGALTASSLTFQLLPGEILGVAGVDGSGQHELAEAIIGLRSAQAGHIYLAGEEVSRLNIRERQEKGVAYIPEDRHRAGLILNFTVAENYLLGHERSAEWGGGFLLDPSMLGGRAERMIRERDVRAGTLGAAVRAGGLSGGNQQKLVVARAMDSGPRLLVACQPTRGLDVEASRAVYQTLQQAAAGGTGILLFSLDLDEILQLSDRIMVMYNGRIAGVLSRAEATVSRLGAMMTGSVESQTPADTGPLSSNNVKGEFDL